MNLLRRLCWLAPTGFLVAFAVGCGTVPPTAGPTPPAPQPTLEGVSYTIQPGDTLYSIARRHGVTWQAVLDANPSLNPRDLRAGQVILIPTGGVSPTEPPVPMLTHNPGHPGPIAAEPNFIWPIQGELISRYRQRTPWRMGEPNSGIDIRAEPGQPVVAAKSGLVNTFAKVHGFGRMIALVHEDGTVSLYGHLDEILCTHGTWVRQGEVIATAGSSGNASGTELHFRIMQGEQFVDPLPLLAR